MDEVHEQQLGSDTTVKSSTPPFPATTAEYITVLAHFHRAEMGRMAGWRDRIDRTTNWAITGVAAMLSLSLSTPTSHHGVLLFAMVLVQLLLLIEARRYRFFDVYRGRVRRLEKYYFAQILAPLPAADNSWTRLLGQDLRKPQFLISIRAAMSRRLRRNYLWMFLILLLAWVLKISTPKLQDEGVGLDVARSLHEIIGNAAFGAVPGWIIILLVILFYCWLAYAALLVNDPDETEHSEVRV
ncbi:DUF2270 domain-containing protein [Phyllobacterium sp. A18/5-2]|jgi:uncharacterized membrane protein|uniref:DUF2270 domain-containing protein n=1 Tax=Phyllobacterium sp. A18/5-2 TaxID=2978392 RepID=UPI000DDBB063|nr:DUF2270 domain-containing protein [Phyllobacterium sp. A18/5-2]UXN63653.1 DUF2270 domain-containing protein [Phyllobacterium sp. A18/5-2]